MQMNGPPFTEWGPPLKTPPGSASLQGWPSGFRIAIAGGNSSKLSP